MNVTVPEYVWLGRYLTMRQRGFWSNLPKAAEGAKKLVSFTMDQWRPVKGLVISAEV